MRHAVAQDLRERLQRALTHLGADLLQAATWAYAHTLHEIAHACGRPPPPPLSDPAALTGLAERASVSAESIVQTRLETMRRLIAIHGSRAAAQASFDRWDRERRALISRYETGRASAEALQDILERSGLRGTEHIEPVTAVCPTCMEAIAQGTVPLGTITLMIPAHPRCPHRRVVSLERPAPETRLWLGEDETQGGPMTTQETDPQEAILTEADLTTTQHETVEGAQVPDDTETTAPLLEDASVAAPEPPHAAPGSRPRHTQLTEAHALQGARVDRVHRDVEVRIISPGFGSSRSRGQRVYYTESALQHAAGKFAGKKCFLNHPTAQERSARPERDIRDWAASLRESWWDHQAHEVRGIMRTYEPWLMQRLEVAPDEVALSINSDGKTRPGTAEGQPAALVESIDTVQSVDIVTYAGARGGVVRLLESDDAAAFSAAEQREVDAEMLESMSAEEIRAARPDVFVHDASLEERTAQFTEALRPYEERVSQLERELNMRDTRVMVDAVLKTCDLPEKAADRVRAQFTESTCGVDADSTFADETSLLESVQAAAVAEREYIASVSQSVPAARVITGMGPAHAPDGTGQTRLAEAQKRMESLLGTGTAQSSAPATPVVADAAKKMDALLGSRT